LISRRDFLHRLPRWAVAAWALGRGGWSAGPALARDVPPPANGLWLAGDFHCHTVLSHDVWDPSDGLNDEMYTYGWTAGEQIRNAELRGLNFLAITDHDRVDALRLPEYRSNVLTLIPGYEHSLSGGHAGVFVPDVALLPDIVREADGSKDFSTDAGLSEFLGLIHQRGGTAVLNHPFYGNESEGEAVAWGYGVPASRGFDAVEVWNIGWPARHDTIRLADPDNYLSAPWWERQFLPAGRHAAVGGSDNHWRSTFAAQGVGQPTTWVYAGDRSAGAILDGVRAGRTFISAEPPLLRGARMFLDAREAWPGGNAAMVGGKLRTEGPLEVTVRVENATGSRLRLISTGMRVGQKPIVAPTETHTFQVSLPRRGWLRAELFLDPGLWMTAMTSAIHGYDQAPLGVRTSPTTGPPVGYGGQLPTAAIYDAIGI